jgi:putative ATPase
MPANWRIVLDLQKMEAPLAERIRPQKIRDYISQSHLVGQMALWHNKSLKNYSFHNFLGSTGTGKTTLAQIIAQESKRPFYILSAINSGVKDIRDVIEKSETKWWFIHCKKSYSFLWDSPF